MVVFGVPWDAQIFHWVPYMVNFREQGLNIVHQGKTWYKHDYQERGLSGRVLVSRLRDGGFKPHWIHRFVSLIKTH